MEAALEPRVAGEAGEPPVDLLRLSSPNCKLTSPSQQGPGCGWSLDEGAEMAITDYSGDRQPGLSVSEELFRFEMFGGTAESAADAQQYAEELQLPYEEGLSLLPLTPPRKVVRFSNPLEVAVPPRDEQGGVTSKAAAKCDESVLSSMKVAHFLDFEMDAEKKGDGKGSAPAPAPQDLAPPRKRSRSKEAKTPLLVIPQGPFSSTSRYHNLRQRTLATMMEDPEASSDEEEEADKGETWNWKCRADARRKEFPNKRLFRMSVDKAVGLGLAEHGAELKGIDGHLIKVRKLAPFVKLICEDFWRNDTTLEPKEVQKRTQHVMRQMELTKDRPRFMGGDKDLVLCAFKNALVNSGLTYADYEYLQKGLKKAPSYARAGTNYRAYWKSDTWRICDPRKAKAASAKPKASSRKRAAQDNVNAPQTGARQAASAKHSAASRKRAALEDLDAPQTGAQQAESAEPRAASRKRAAPDLFDPSHAAAPQAASAKKRTVTDEAIPPQASSVKPTAASKKRAVAADASPPHMAAQEAASVKPSVVSRKRAVASPPHVAAPQAASVRARVILRKRTVADEPSPPHAAAPLSPPQKKAKTVHQHRPFRPCDDPSTHLAPTHLTRVAQSLLILSCPGE